MTDRPIIFSGPMVNALIDGRKTQTRRLINLPEKTRSGGPIYERSDMGGWEATEFPIEGVSDGSEALPPMRAGIWHQTCGTCVVAPYQIGDRLYVRETWGVGTRPHPAKGCVDGIEYRADQAYLGQHDDLPLRQFDEMVVPDDFEDDNWRGKWNPSIFMPRWASRLTLIVTDVRVQRLQEISEKDAIAEGVHLHKLVPDDPYANLYTIKLPSGARPRSNFARPIFERLWDSLNEKRAPWADNPWVVAVSFTVERGNIDQLEKKAA